jgi:peptidoglycan/xylan/chitin deacetylase (PgdA/CDA1 family)
MNALSLMYHDVVEDGQWDSSGFAGPGAAVYKLEAREFEQHLAAIQTALAGNSVDVIECVEWGGSRWPVFLTFDDGGVSASTCIAKALESRGWRGHFFITTDRLVDPAFLNPEQVGELRARGHVIGSHSCSHPRRMSYCPPEDLAREWLESIRILTGILKEPVTVASVPGGYYSRRVASAAAAAGIRYLFTSEPTARVSEVDGCRILGRYYVQRGMPPETSAAFAVGLRRARFRQALLWKCKKAAKALGGGIYLKAREAALRGYK